MQEKILDENPEAGIRVIAVWFDMRRGDDRSRWPSEQLTDPRVSHFWDADKVVGTWYGEQVTAQEPGHVEWDMFFLYDRRAVWSEEHPDFVSSGRTIYDQKDKLLREATKLIGSAE